MIKTAATALWAQHPEKLTEEHLILGAVGGWYETLRGHCQAQEARCVAPRASSTSTIPLWLGWADGTKEELQLYLLYQDAKK